MNVTIIVIFWVVFGISCLKLLKFLKRRGQKRRKLERRTEALKLRSENRAVQLLWLISKVERRLKFEPGSLQSNAVELMELASRSLERANELRRTNDYLAAELIAREGCDYARGALGLWLHEIAQSMRSVTDSNTLTER